MIQGWRISPGLTRDQLQHYKVALVTEQMMPQCEQGDSYSSYFCHVPQFLNIYSCIIHDPCSSCTDPPHNKLMPPMTEIFLVPTPCFMGLLSSYI